MIEYNGYAHGKISFNAASTIWSHVSLVIQHWLGRGYTLSKYWQPLQTKLIATDCLPHLKNERQWSFNDFWSCNQGNWKVIQWLCTVTVVLASFMGQTWSVTVTAPFWQSESTVHQQLLSLHLGLSTCWVVIIIHIQCIGSHFRQKSACEVGYTIMKMSINGALTISGILNQLITMWPGSDEA